MTKFKITTDRDVWFEYITAMLNECKITYRVEIERFSADRTVYRISGETDKDHDLYLLAQKIEALGFGHADLMVHKNFVPRNSGRYSYFDYKYVEQNTEIKDVKFNGPATIVFWTDGTKTVVKCSEMDIYDPEKALMMAMLKKKLGNPSKVRKFFKKWIPESESEFDYKDALDRVLDYANKDWFKDTIDRINKSLVNDAWNEEN